MRSYGRGRGGGGFEERNMRIQAEKREKKDHFD
jgi:hypothetical protein